MLGALLALILVLLCFVALAIVCDDYLCPALEVICKRHSIPDHVAAASLLALGSAAPELAMNAVATSHVNSNEIKMSVPAIMGSGVIAFGLIPAVCCLAVTGKHWKPSLASENTASADGAGSTALFSRLSAWPVVRDTSVYALCLGANIMVLEDGTIDTQEAGVLVALFFLYMLVVYKIKAPAWLEGSGRDGGAGKAKEDKGWPVAAVGNPMAALLADGGDGAATVPSYGSLQERGAMEKGLQEQEEAAEADNAAVGCFGKMYGLIAAPMDWIFAHTIPACECPDDELLPLPSSGRTAAAFLLSIAYVSVLSYAVLELTKAGSSAAGVPRATAGATLLALGAQVPDTIASLAMARSGMLDGAVSNAIGSQVINVTLGTGLPFLLYCLIEHAQIVTKPAGMCVLLRRPCSARSLCSPALRSQFLGSSCHSCFPASCWHTSPSSLHRAMPHAFSVATVPV